MADGPGGTLRVLVVDDNVDAGESLAVLLNQWGHATHVARTSVDALSAFPIFRPHAVILDLGLPQMDGYELARQLRQLASRTQLVIVALTGYADESHRLRAEQDFDRYLVKPGDLESLQAMLASLWPSP